MTDKTELVFNTGHVVDLTDGLHDVVLNRLNSWHENGGKRRFYDAEEFRKVLPEFKNTPHIFADVHPQNIGKMPLEDALQEVNGRIIGTPQDVLVTNTNVFMEKFKVEDPEVDELMKQGKVHVSTAFSASLDDDGKYFNIKPNHVLFFPVSTGIDPGDPSSLILNQMEGQVQSEFNQSEKNGLSDIMTEDNKNDQLDLLKELVLNQQEKGGLQVKITEQTVKLSEQVEIINNQKTEIEGLKSTVEQKDNLLSEKETLITNQASDIEALKGKVLELNQQIDNINIAAKNARRERIFNQYAPGIKKAFESRKEEIFDDSKFEEIFFEMNQAQMGIKQPPTEPSGVEDVTNQEEPMTAGVSVEKDPVTGKMVTKILRRS